MRVLTPPPPPSTPSPSPVGVVYSANSQCSNVGGTANDPFCDQFDYSPESGATGNHFCCSCEAIVSSAAITAEGSAGEPGLVYCYGSRDSGQCGDNRPISTPSIFETPRLPAIPLGTNSLFTALAVSQESFSTVQLLSPFVCAIASDSGRPWCWGSFPLSTSTLLSPTLVPGARTFNKIAAGGTYACGIDRDGGAIACWSGVASEPVVVSGTSSFSGLAMGATSVCGLSGTIIWCWDSLSLENIPAPVAVVAVEAQGFISLSSGPSMTCGVSTTTDIWCWSVAPGGSSIDAKRVAVGPFTFISVGKDAACAVDFLGHASCWGVNPYNWLGLTDASAIVTIASPVRGNLVFQSLSVGSASGKAHVCGITFGKLVCWGATAFGRTGTGFPVGTLTLPTDVDLTSMQPTSSSIAYSVASSASYTCAIFADPFINAQAITEPPNDQWACLNLGWQYHWDGVHCIQAPNCDENPELSWDGSSCTNDFAPATCNSKEFSYNPRLLSCGEPRAMPMAETIKTYVDLLSTSLNGLAPFTIATLPSQDTPLGSTLSINDTTGFVNVFMTILLRGASSSEFDEVARNAFGDAVFTALTSMGVQDTMGTALIVIIDARDTITQFDDVTAGATLRLRRVAVTSAGSSRQLAIVNSPALAIDFYISTQDALFALNAAALATFAMTPSDTIASQVGLTTAAAADLGTAFQSALTLALKTNPSLAFTTSSIVTLSTMLAAITIPSIIDAPPASATNPPNTSAVASATPSACIIVDVIKALDSGADAAISNAKLRSISDAEVIGIVISVFGSIALLAIVLHKFCRQGGSESVRSGFGPGALASTTFPPTVSSSSGLSDGTPTPASASTMLSPTATVTTIRQE